MPLLIIYPGMPLPYLAFKNALLKLFRNFRILEHEHLLSLFATVKWNIFCHMGK